MQLGFESAECYRSPDNRFRGGDGSSIYIHFTKLHFCVVMLSALRGRFYAGRRALTAKKCADLTRENLHRHFLNLVFCFRIEDRRCGRYYVFTRYPQAFSGILDRGKRTMTEEEL